MVVSCCGGVGGLVAEIDLQRHQGIDANKIKLARTFGASKGQILHKVLLPGSVPTQFAALKVNAGLSLVGVVVAKGALIVRELGHA